MAVNLKIWFWGWLLVLAVAFVAGYIAKAAFHSEAAVFWAVSVTVLIGTLAVYYLAVVRPNRASRTR